MPPYNPNTNFNNQQNIQRTNTQDDWGGYIDIRMNADEKLLFTAWFESNETDVISWLYDVLPTGLKLGLMWDGENQCYVASLNGKGMNTSEKRFTLTARAGTVTESFALLCYKHYVLLESDWGNFKPSGRRQSWG